MREGGGREEGGGGGREVGVSSRVARIFRQFLFYPLLNNGCFIVVHKNEIIKFYLFRFKNTETMTVRFCFLKDKHLSYTNQLKSKNKQPYCQTMKIDSFEKNLLYQTQHEINIRSAWHYVTFIHIV